MFVLVGIAIVLMGMYILLLILRNHYESYSVYEKELKLAENTCFSVVVLCTLQLLERQEYTSLLSININHTLTAFLEVFLVVSLVLVVGLVGSRSYFLGNQEQLDVLRRVFYYLFKAPQQIFDLACGLLVLKILKPEEPHVHSPKKITPSTTTLKTPLLLKKSNKLTNAQNSELSQDYFQFFEQSLLSVIATSEAVEKQTEAIENCSEIKLHTHKTPVFISQNEALEEDELETIITGYIDSICLLDTSSITAISDINSFAYTPESITIIDALKILKQEQVQLGLLVSETGACNGYFTKADLKELLANNLRKSPSYNYLQFITRGSVQLPAQATIKEVNKVYRTKFTPTLEYKTLSGLFMHKLGRVAKKGDSISFNEVTLIVMDVRGPKIITIKMQISKQ